MCESSSEESSLNESSLVEFSIEDIEPPNGTLQELMKNFQSRLQDQYSNDSNITIITINENIIVESLIQWANASDKDLLQCPSIELVLEE